MNRNFIIKKQGSNVLSFKDCVLKKLYVLLTEITLAYQINKI